jgi:hypothetical protein
LDGLVSIRFSLIVRHHFVDKVDHDGFRCAIGRDLSVL